MCYDLPNAKKPVDFELIQKCIQNRCSEFYNSVYAANVFNRTKIELTVACNCGK